MSVTILPPNASASELALDQTSARLDAIPSPLRHLWNPQLCPEALLPWLAWALSVDAWDPNWRVEAKRRVCADAVAVHRIKGTIGAVRQGLAALGATAEVKEWFEIAGEPHTFELLVWAGHNPDATAEVMIDAALIAQLRDLAERLKPARSHLQKLTIGARLEQALFAGCVHNSFATLRESLTPSLSAQIDLQNSVGALAQTGALGVSRVIAQPITSVSPVAIQAGQLAATTYATATLRATAILQEAA
ncbi:phage tail protein I [Magnetofaba australis]|uniref:Putative phage tail protein I n=1 Tax=Magnetofaba australis IT-1 TaxID=1434232 RepID=A0A1Y2K0Y0_9PROT|nr:phage tail protein I [Magnetofaba australis]OSM01658.1 putative phage tail protein I [Magnetofaba australis IT-1]